MVVICIGGIKSTQCQIDVIVSCPPRPSARNIMADQRNQRKPSQRISSRQSAETTQAKASFLAADAPSNDSDVEIVPANAAAATQHHQTDLKDHHEDKVWIQHITTS